MDTEKVKQELTAIAEKHGGLIPPTEVVEAAKRKKSAMHPWFTWDDSEAAARYRINQARELIRAVKVEIGDQSPREVRAFVSLSQDRGSGGYRALADVLSDKGLYAQMLEDALAELERFEQKYSRLQELEPLFREAQKVRKAKKAA